MSTLVHRLASTSVVVLAIAATSACSADVHDNTLDVHDNTANIDDAKVKIETTSDVDNVQAGTTMHVSVAAEDVFLIDPSMMPPADRVMVAGHFEFFLDSMSGTSLMVTAEESVDILIPPTTAAGDHKLLCRVDKHDGTPTEATSEIDFTVKAIISTN